MKHLISKEDRLFLAEVESCKFPIEAFDHRAHLRLAYIYLAERNVDCAYDLTRKTLLKLLEHNNIDPAKFHVTMTRAWILAVKHFMASMPATVSADAFINNKPLMLDAKIMLSHYSEENLFSELARKKFVQPDLNPIPVYSD